MRVVLSLLLAINSSFFYSQNLAKKLSQSTTFLNELNNGDSVVYYQCHIESAQQELITASGQTLSSVSKNMSITEKFVLHKSDNNYELTRFVSVLTMCPNRRFSGLKFGEKAYWEFYFKESKTLSGDDLKALDAIENIGKEANEYDFAISIKNSNQVIILSGNKAKQLGLSDQLLLSKLFN